MLILYSSYIKGQRTACFAIATHAAIAHKVALCSAGPCQIHILE